MAEHDYAALDRALIRRIRKRIDDETASPSAAEDREALLAELAAARLGRPPAAPLSDGDPSDPMRLGALVARLPVVKAARKVTRSRVHRRLIEPISEEERRRFAFQHTVLCQTSLPYHDPGDDVRLWTRRQGNTTLEIQAGRLPDPATRVYADMGLPWGVKPRLILAHLNAEALRQGSPVIEIESSLSAFVERIRGFKGGRELRAFRDQLGRLSAATVRLALFREHQAHGVETKLITSFELWFHKDERQRVLWPSTIRLSQEYFESLQQHAVPLNEVDLAALAHSALALDLYAWLAYRLHGVKAPVFVPWAGLKQQFGADYGRMIDFKRKFRTALGQVQARYREARLDLDEHGMKLHQSPTPVSPATRQQVLLPPRAPSG